MAATAIFFFCLVLFSFSEAIRNGGGGFSASLFHRDSPLSPLHNPSLSHYDRLHNAFLRSFSRSAELSHRAVAVSTDAIHSPIVAASGEFLMEVSIGTPRVDFIAIADTGSDLTWTQCLPCKKCFNQSRPIFNPRRSSSYRHVSCTSDACRSLDDSGCGPDGRTCGYGYSYGDRSYTYGEIGLEKITIGSFNLRNTVFGCGHENGGTFGGISSGIIGLGGGSLSLVSQLKEIAAVKRRFSYCLPNLFNNKITGNINFGKNGGVSGRKVVTTGLVPKNPDTYYYLTLEALSVGNKRFEADMSSSSAGNQTGNIIIDSGTTLTFLPQNLYHGIVSTLEKVVRTKRVDDPNRLLELCFAAAGSDEVEDMPVITAHFAGGADVKLPPLNTLALVADNVTCLTLAPSSDLAIFGNLAQMNFLVGYDLERKGLSFKPQVCD